MLYQLCILFNVKELNAKMYLSAPKGVVYTSKQGGV